MWLNFSSTFLLQVHRNDEWFVETQKKVYSVIQISVEHGPQYCFIPLSYPNPREFPINKLLFITLFHKTKAFFNYID